MKIQLFSQIKLNKKTAKHWFPYTYDGSCCEMGKKQLYGFFLLAHLKCSNLGYVAFCALF